LGIRAYALIGFFIISLLSTQYAFAQVTSCPNPDDVIVDGVCVSAFGDDEPGPQAFTVSTDRTSYSSGNIIRISGNVGTLNENYEVKVTLMILDPEGNIVTISSLLTDSSGAFSKTINAGGPLWELTGYYEVRAQYDGGAHKSSTTFYFIASGDPQPEPEPEPTPTPFDTTPPKILKPSDVIVDATDSNGARVTYEVLAIDDTDNIIKPTCRPSSGSFFSVGDTSVSCTASDSAGNSARPIAFTVTVIPLGILIPDWIKEVASFWCDDKIDDSSFIEGIQYLIDNDIILVPSTSSGYGSSQSIPSWIKNNACWWSQNLISDEDFAGGLQYLISQGIIRV